MSWSPNDLLTDADLRGYEERILNDYGVTTWEAKRVKALEDWLFPILTSRGFDPFKLRTRAAVDKAFGYTAAAYTDLTSATQDGTADDVNLAAIFATPANDALYLGSSRPFRGLFSRAADTVSSAAAVLSVAYWNGGWENLQIADGTRKTAGKTFSGGGSILWALPMDWQTRVVNSSAALYWVKVTISAVPTSAKAGQISVIWSSALRAPATFRTLMLIFREAPSSGEGPWQEKGDFYERQADEALTRALAICGGEFDTDASDVIDGDEPEQTVAEVSRVTGGALLERG